jgi:hypothetical protein
MRRGAAMNDFRISGIFRILTLYDVAEEIRLDELRNRIASVPQAGEPSLKPAAPEYAHLARTPVIESIDPVLMKSGEQLKGKIKYYDYGVVSLELELRFEGDWTTLIELGSRWIGSPDIERSTVETVERHLKRLAPALIKGYTSWLSEDYYIFHVEQARRCSGISLTAEELLQECGAPIVQIIRGEKTPLSSAERTEVLQGAISYYPADLLIVGWTAALVYDTPEGATSVLQLLEHANAHLLELRHYDRVLSEVLRTVYRSLGRRGGALWRWRLAGEAHRLNTIRLDVKELTERADVSLKFLSDMFYARVYRLASTKIGVPDYRNLVEDKLRTAADLYQFMVSEFHQTRAFVLELMVVIILIIDLIVLFRGAVK